MLKKLVKRKGLRGMKESFVKYPRKHLRKDNLYKARKHPKQKGLKLKKWFKKSEEKKEVNL